MNREAELALMAFVIDTAEGRTTDAQKDAMNLLMRFDMWVGPNGGSSCDCTVCTAMDAESEAELTRGERE